MDQRKAGQVKKKEKRKSEAKRGRKTGVHLKRRLHLGPSLCGTNPGHFETSNRSLSHKQESEQVSEQTNKWAQRAVLSRQMSEGYEQTSEWMSEWPNTCVLILGSSEPLAEPEIIFSSSYFFSQLTVWVFSLAKTQNFVLENMSKCKREWKKPKKRGRGEKEGEGPLRYRLPRMKTDTPTSSFNLASVVTGEKRPCLKMRN